jgi:predicted Zn-dependent peptidase
MIEGRRFHSGELKESYEFFRHSSGLRVYVCPKALRQTHAILGTNFGAVDRVVSINGTEETLPAGVAHFLEHKMFESEDGSDAFSQFAAVGAQANAYTSLGVTAYYFSCTGRFAEALPILLGFVSSPYFTQENVEKEMDIIGQEIRMYEDQPHSRLYWSLISNLYAKHPIRDTVTGTVSSIREITPELLYRIHSAFYHPENMILAVCGKVTAQEVSRILDESFRITDAVAGESLPVEEPIGVACAASELRMQVARPLVSIGAKDVRYPTDPMEREKRNCTLDLALDLIFGRSSEFYNRYYAEGLFADDFSADYDSFSGGAFFAATCETDEPERFCSLVKQEIAAFLEKEPNPRDFTRLKRCLYADFVRAFDNTEEIANLLFAQGGRGVDLFSIGQIIQSITPEDVKAAFCDMFSDAQFATVVVRPISS